MSNNREATTQQSFPMKGGDGPHSYVNNSHLQREATDACRTMIEEAIAQKLDVKCFSSNPFRLADLGCSVGPNTFISMQHIVEAVERKYLEQGLKSQIPEFQVFFNDHATNDFNTLFASLPTERRYFACGVPGSFHGRLFPESSIHFMFSSHAIHWLSKVPKELLDKNSPAWNRGRIHYTSAPDEVSHAYAAQFGHDMEIFLSARAKELVVGGIIVLTMAALPDGIPASQIPSGVMFDLLGASLMDMTKSASQEQMTDLVKRNGCFTIERMELVYRASKLVAPITGKECGMHLRAGMEGMIAKHFGSGIIDELFDTFRRNLWSFPTSWNQAQEKELNYSLL
ncbi:putative S-adenosylmethionine-dependent methyltransferase [Vitis vinifera]|uniref:Putative S-adenosylmethionine-dependent methyltransferase n=1 Tax=Vitis vinifera TaxID=29760 RepID=A0A438HXL1_VITVI|nr:putative S-adenosylmethionine-dependent methyltransferase [Vitis vinifera]